VPLPLKHFLPIGGRNANPSRVEITWLKLGSVANCSVVVFSR
jgi:hypothetical protein